MKHQVKSSSDPAASKLTTELLLLPDGRILVHNLTPAFARLLAGLNPDCGQIASRVTRHPSLFRERSDRSAEFTPLQYPEGKHLRTRKRRERRAPVASEFKVPMRGQHLENCP
jgi:hypothetical protein